MKFAFVKWYIAPTIWVCGILYNNRAFGVRLLGQFQVTYMFDQNTWLLPWSCSTEMRENSTT